MSKEYVYYVCMLRSTSFTIPVKWVVEENILPPTHLSPYDTYVSDETIIHFQDCRKKTEKRLQIAFFLYLIMDCLYNSIDL